MVPLLMDMWVGSSPYMSLCTFAGDFSGEEFFEVKDLGQRVWTFASESTRALLTLKNEIWQPLSYRSNGFSGYQPSGQNCERSFWKLALLLIWSRDKGWERRRSWVCNTRCGAPSPPMVSVVWPEGIWRVMVTPFATSVSDVTPTAEQWARMGHCGLAVQQQRWDSSGAVWELRTGVVFNLFLGEMGAITHSPQSSSVS